ncbi:NAD-dependent epimerase/dehydratase family protein [Bacillus sonorensis]|nr:NAD-dependent epimerase/dehydratase family protein [Bacillus sonorensis]
MSILVVGGANYIGSHAVYTLIEKKEKVVVVDSLATGDAEAVHPKAVFYQGDIRDLAFSQTSIRKRGHRNRHAFCGCSDFFTAGKRFCFL